MFAFLRRVEGERNRAYKDAAGMYTCGVGHASGVTASTCWDQKTIDAVLAQDVHTAATRLAVAIGPARVNTLSDFQYAALLSFVFNSGAKANWRVWADIRAGHLALVPGQLKLFDHVNGKPNPGLLNRRNAEIALWSGKDPLCERYPQTVA